MSDAASFDAIMQCNLLEVFCEALDAAIIVTDKLDELSFASIRLLHHFPVSENAIAPGSRARDLYGALYDAGCRFGVSGGGHKDKNREDWIAERVASAWKERIDTIEPCGQDRWFRIVSRRFSSGLGLTVIQDVSEHKKKENQWRIEHERVRMTEEILDTMPVAVAIKDRNLNFAAVNQQFCKMLNITPEAVLGRGIWDIVEPGLAASLEEEDWHLLASGRDRESVIKIDRADGEPARFLHRARRVGRAGNHYLSMTFDELQMETTELQVLPDSTFGVGATDTTSSAKETSPIDKAGTVPRRKVAYVHAGEAGAVVRQAHERGIELCIIRSETEFAAFLPALAKAGITLDLVVIERTADLTIAAFAARHGVRHHLLPTNTDVVQSILEAFEQPFHPIPVSETNILHLVAVPDVQSHKIDILAIEDNPVNRLVIEQIFESLGLNFLVFSNGMEAIGKIAQYKPKIILVDITLPDMEIADFTRLLDPVLKECGVAPSVIGLISNDGTDQHEICKRAGLKDTLAKPLSPEAVDRMLRKHLLHEPAKSSKSTKSAA